METFASSAMKEKICVIDAVLSSVHSQKRESSLEERTIEQRLCDHPGQGSMVEVCEGVETSPKVWKGPGLWPVPYVAGTGEHLLGGRTGLREEQLCGAARKADIRDQGPGMTVARQ